MSETAKSLTMDKLRAAAAKVSASATSAKAGEEKPKPAKAKPAKAAKPKAPKPKKEPKPKKVKAPKAPKAPKASTKKASSGQSGPKLEIAVGDLNKNETKVLAVIKQHRAKPLSLADLAKETFPSKTRAQANSWVRNSLRRLVRAGFVHKEARGTYAGGPSPKGEAGSEAPVSPKAKAPVASPPASTPNEPASEPENPPASEPEASAPEGPAASDQ